jgi:hypothetical protein
VTQRAALYPTDMRISVLNLGLVLTETEKDVSANGYDSVRSV